MIFSNEKNTAVEDLLHRDVPAIDNSAYEGIHPGAGYGRQAAEQPAAYFIVQREGEGSPKTHRCDNEQEVRIFLETLIAQGVSQDAIDLFKASKVTYNVTFKPIVDLTDASSG